MDKLIEAAQGLIALGPPERAQDQLWSTWQKRVKAYNLLVAAASHAAESAPMLPSDTLHICAACWAGNHGSCSGGKCGCVHESASVAQLDAEDQHPKMRAANAEARKGYVKLEDVEKAIRAELDMNGWSDCFFEGLRERLAPKPSLKVPYADCDAVDQWYVVDEKGEQIEIRFTNKRDAERYAAGLRAELAALAERRAGK